MFHDSTVKSYGITAKLNWNWTNWNCLIKIFIFHQKPNFVKFDSDAYEVKSWIYLHFTTVITTHLWYLNWYKKNSEKYSRLLFKSICSNHLITYRTHIVRQSLYIWRKIMVNPISFRHYRNSIQKLTIYIVINQSSIKNRLSRAW